MGNQLILVLTAPQDIIQIEIFNQERISRGKTINSMQPFFHLFGQFKDQEWKLKREVFKKYVYADAALQKLFEPTKLIVKTALTKKANNTFFSLHHFSFALAWN